MNMAVVVVEVLQNNIDRHVGCYVSDSRIIPEDDGRQADYITAAAAATESSITSHSSAASHNIYNIRHYVSTQTETITPSCLTVIHLNGRWRDDVS